MSVSKKNLDFTRCFACAKKKIFFSYVGCTVLHTGTRVFRLAKVKNRVFLEKPINAWSKEKNGLSNVPLLLFPILSL